ncbi:MAG: cupredoxin domain-containing protein [Alphaproteobacteria bacterium]
MIDRRRLIFALAFLLPVCVGLPHGASAGASAGASGDGPFEVRIVIRDHRFEPATPEVPADRALKLIVTNADSTPEEFESVGLKIERVIAGGKTAEFAVRPLRKNRNYKFFGEFHPATAQGRLVVK